MRVYSEAFVLFPRLGFVDVEHPLAEVVLRSCAVIDTLEPEDGLVDILVDLGPAI
jgi:hypothetical protein